MLHLRLLPGKIKQIRLFALGRANATQIVRFTWQAFVSLVMLVAREPDRHLTSFLWVGGNCISNAAKYYFKTNSSPIFAYIKKSNKASIHSFKRAGYAFLRQEEIKGHPSVVYQLQKI